MAGLDTVTGKHVPNAGRIVRMSCSLTEYKVADMLRRSSKRYSAAATPGVVVGFTGAVLPFLLDPRCQEMNNGPAVAGHGRSECTWMLKSKLYDLPFFLLKIPILYAYLQSGFSGQSASVNRSRTMQMQVAWVDLCDSVRAHGVAA